MKVPYRKPKHGHSPHEDLVLLGEAGAARSAKDPALHFLQQDGNQFRAREDPGED